MAANQQNKWPKASVAIFGSIAIALVAFLLKEPNALWALVLLYWIVGEI